MDTGESKERKFEKSKRNRETCFNIYTDIIFYIQIIIFLLFCQAP